MKLSCVQPSSLQGPWENLFCTWLATESTNLALTISDKGVTSTTTEPFTSPQGINAFGVRMVYESTDLSDLSSTSSTSPIPHTTSTKNAQPTASPTATVGADSLSRGAKIGIGVAVPLVVIGAVLLALFLWRKRAKHSTGASNNAKYEGYRNSSTDFKHESGGTQLSELGGKPFHQELGGRPVHEMEGRELPTEMSSQSHIRPWDGR